MRSRLFSAYREQISYLFFGVLTTLINYSLFWLLDLLWCGRYVLTANLITFTVSTLFAYITNKIFVFQSHSWKPNVLAREVAVFVSSRLFSFALEEAGLYVAAYLMHLGRYDLGPFDGVMVAKVLLSAVAVVLNYFFSKFLVFSRKREKEASTNADSVDSSGIQ